MDDDVDREGEHGSCAHALSQPSHPGSDQALCALVLVDVVAAAAAAIIICRPHRRGGSGCSRWLSQGGGGRQGRGHDKCRL